MGLLDRMAMMRERKQIAPFFRGDERFIQAVVMKSVTVQWHDTGQRERYGHAALSLTNRAIYVRIVKNNDGTILRLPYETVMRVNSVGKEFEIGTMKASWLFAYTGTPMGTDNSEIIVEHLSKLDRYRKIVDVPGGKVSAIRRKVEEDGEPVWILHPSDGVDDIDDEAVKRTLNEQLPNYSDHGSIVIR